MREKTFRENGSSPQDLSRKESPRKKPHCELQEETGLKGEFVRKGESFPIETPKVHVNPVLVTVEDEEVELSREHIDFRWVGRSDLEVLDTVPKLKQDLERVGIT
jgi:8-oxo-dGTP pyrophosphatase MutT (NUDIX family)